MKENLDIFFKGPGSLLAEFKIGGQVVRVRGYFEDAFFDSSVGQVVLNSRQPRFMCKESDVAKVQRDMKVTVKGVQYAVLEVQPDGTGVSTVLLANQ